MPHTNRRNELRGRALARREPPDAPRHQLCKKKYTGVVMRALGWGIWKMHASKPDSMMYHDSILLLSMALYDAGSQDEAMEVLKASHDQLSS